MGETVPPAEFKNARAEKKRAEMREVAYTTDPSLPVLVLAVRAQVTLPYSSVSTDTDLGLSRGRSNSMQAICCKLSPLPVRLPGCQLPDVLLVTFSNRGSDRHALPPSVLPVPLQMHALSHSSAMRWNEMGRRGAGERSDKTWRVKAAPATQA